MDVIKFLATFILSITINFSSYGICNEDYDSEESNNQAFLYPVRHEENKKRHEIPGKCVIKCIYTSHSIRLIMPIHILTMQVSIGGEEDPIWQGWIDASYPSAEIPMLDGEYEIVCRTPENQIFKGNLQFAN
ncbi:MAG: hypothetical protein NC411_02215 [Bacteroides sp.]|nr:hypothetical protein [Bacteroides sp.]